MELDGSGLCPAAESYQALAKQLGIAESLHLPGRCHNFFYFEKGQPDSLAKQIHHILTTHHEPPTRCVELEQLTWKANVRLMVGAVMGR